MSRLTDLLARLRDKDASLAADLEREISALSERRAFGLNFERHVPEAVELPGRKVRKGDKVHVLPSRGETGSRDKTLWRVISITAGMATLENLEADNDLATKDATVEDLVVVAEFRDPIYPGLISTGKVERGGDKPFHLVINAENYHALQTLLFTHRGKVDCIYIDPPYNTGARDWKYNNDYVEGEDLYRHSKWLAMIERRLLLAKDLLNPDDSVLIVTIDEKEYLRLGMLLEQTFPTARLQMVSSVISPQGAARKNQFARTDEYLFFVAFGAAAPAACALSRDWMGNIGSTVKGKLHWSGLRRTGTNAARKDRPNLFYPVFISADSDRFVAVGDAIPLTSKRELIEVPPACHVVWPVRSDGSEGNWQISAGALRAAIEKGFVRLGRPGGSETTISYLKSGEQKKVEDGKFEVVGRRPDGSVMVNDLDSEPEFVPGTQWSIPSHDASRNGSNLLRELIPGRKFPFPKSLYAVEDAVRFFVKEKPAALIVDFFGGSGTTGHAVMRLNHQDGGSRSSIVITNNEVSDDEAKELRAGGLAPGDPKWEARGIFQYITKPRIEAAVTGITHTGVPVKGDYKFVDEFPMSEGFEENVEFFNLTYEAPLRVSSHREFTKIAPLLWIRAGSRGRRIDDVIGGWDVADAYGVLADLDRTEEFLQAVIGAGDDLRVAFIVTDEDRLFESVARSLPEYVEPVRLYESYLRNFEIESGRGML